MPGRGKAGGVVSIAAVLQGEQREPIIGPVFVFVRTGWTARLAGDPPAQPWQQVDWESASESVEAVRTYIGEWEPGNGYIAEVTGELRAVERIGPEPESIEPEPAVPGQLSLFSEPA